MGARDGATLTLRLVTREPLLPAAAAGVALVATLLNGLWSVPLLGAVLGPLATLLYVFVEPFVAAGVLGMADEAIDGELTRSTFLERGQAHYTDLLVARLVLLVPAVLYAVLVRTVQAGLTAGLAVSTMDGGIGSLPAGSPPLALESLTPSHVAALAVLAVLAAVVAVGIAGYVLVQFYPAAIVVGGADPLESFRYSYELVREHPRSAVGYTALTSLGGFALLLPELSRLLVSNLLELSELAGADATGVGLVPTVAGAAVGLVTFLLVKTVVVALVRTYHVAFVRTTLGRA